MTNNAFKIKEKRTSILPLICLIVTVFTGIVLSGEMAELVSEGMSLAVRCVVPSSFPFMIISDLYVSYGHPEKIKSVEWLAYRLLGLPASAIGALICGNVGGFPIGAKITGDLYREGAIDRESAERLVALSANPSSAFIVGAVGLGMYRDETIGVILLLSVYLSSLTCGFLTKQKHNNTLYSDNIMWQNYNFVASVKNAGISSVSVISFVSLFSVIVGLIKKYVKIGSVVYPLIAILEVTNAAKIFADSSLFPTVLSVSLVAFSLGFGGLSVLMQNAVFIEGTGLKMKKYTVIKLMQGVISAALATLFTLIYI